MMRRIAAVLLGAAFLFSLAASASPAIPIQIYQPYFVCQVSTTVATRCQAGPIGAFNAPAVQLAVGYQNNSITAQTASVTCYDNDGAASGPVALSIAPLAAGASVNVEFLFGIQAEGSFRVVVDAELLP